LPNCNIGDVINIKGFEYLVENIDHVKIDWKSLYINSHWNFKLLS
jgi:hypothetical protein